MRHYGECEWVTARLVWFSMFTREKGTEIRRKKETGDLLGEILGPWIPLEGGKKKEVPPRSVAVKEILDPWIPLEGKKKKKVPPKFVAVKEKERNEKYIFFKNKNQKIRINMKP